MKTTNIITSLIFIFVTVLACNKDNVILVPVLATTYKDLPADPGTGGRDNTGHNPIGEKNKFTFFSFKTGAIVDNADSASSKWDIGFKGTDIVFNSGDKGPGNSVAQIVNGSFDNYSMAPSDGYTLNSLSSTDEESKWYIYDHVSMTVSAKAGRVIVVRTSDNRYAKLEILGYYLGNPTKPDPTKDKDRYYTFRYVYQPNDSKSFES